MAEISNELLENEWITYNGLKNFLKDKKLSFGEEMNSKYRFKDESLKSMDDWDAYKLIKGKYTRRIDDIKKT
jgi:hypothetical protein